MTRELEHAAARLELEAHRLTRPSVRYCIGNQLLADVNLTTAARLRALATALTPAPPPTSAQEAP